MINTINLPPFKKMCITIGNLPSSFMESMSYYEALCWLYDYFENTLLPAINTNSEAITELQTAFLTLKSYVDNYFENLDVQTEINNKLDAMAEDGTLTTLIGNYVYPILADFESDVNETLSEQTLAINTLQTTVNNSLTTINTKVDSLASGSPAGVYDTVSDLTTADPDHSKIYVVAENGNWYYYDASTTSWVAGGVYQASVDPNDVEKLRSDIDHIVSDVDVLYNLVDADSMTDGGFINPNSGNLVTTTGYAYSDSIEVKANQEYNVDSKGNVYGAFYNNSNTYISGFKFEPNQLIYVTNSFTTPASAKYMKISCIDSATEDLKVYLDGAAILNPDITISTTQVIDKNAYNLIKYTELNVGSGQTYATLREAFAACTNPTYYNRYIVNFYGDGTEYNMYNDFTNAEKADATFIGRYVPQWTKLRGIGGKEKCIIALRLENNSSLISTLNTYGSSELEGLTVIGEKTRYAVHDDFSTINAKRTWKDCKFQIVTSSYKAVVGAGCRSGNTMIFENCIFTTNEWNTRPYSCHNNINFTDSANLYFINCRFINPTASATAVSFGSINNNSNGIINNAYFYGCFINHMKLVEENASAYGAGIKWKVSGYANNITSDDVVIENTDSEDYSSYVDLI